jgi:hypothetical protein
LCCCPCVCFVFCRFVFVLPLQLDTGCSVEHVNKHRIELLQLARL